MNRYISFVTELPQSTSQGEALQLFERGIADFGYDRFSLRYVNELPDTPNPKSVTSAKFPSGWMDHYHKRGYYYHDAIRNCARQTRALFAWDELPEMMHLTTTQKRHLHELKEAGLLNGVTLPLHGPHNETIALNLFNDSGHYLPSKQERMTLSLMAHQFFCMYSSFEKPVWIEPVTLTPREHEIMRWAAEGKSNSVIAEILSISESSIKFHFGNIFRKMHVTNRTAAIAKMQQVKMLP